MDAAVGRLLGWFAAEGEDLPWRRTRDRYAVLVAETQLQATQVARVIPYYERWMGRWPTAASLARVPLGEVLAAWQGLGYPRRARNLHAAARRVAAEGWPADDRLTELPGVGPYTAAAIRCFADGAPVLPIDTNVRRVLARRFPGGWPGTPPGAGWAVGQALMDLGRRACTARAPRCDGGCPLRQGCPAADAGRVAAVTPPGRRQGRYEGSLRQRRGVLLRALADRGRAEVAADPEAAESLVADGLARRRGRLLVRVGEAGRAITAGVAAPRRSRTRQVVVAAVIERGGRVLVSQRGPGGGQAGRWEFPGGKREAGESDAEALRREVREELGIEVVVGERIWSTTAGPLDLRFFRCRYREGGRPRPLVSAQFRWVRLEDLPGYPFPPANQALVRALAEGRTPAVARGDTMDGFTTEG